MSLDDLYNHLKVYESEVQKKTGSSSQNLAFISSSNTSSGKSEVSTAQATQQSGFQIKYEDIIQIDDDDIEEMDIKWKKTGKKITIQGSDVAGFDKSKVECFNCYKMRHFARECRAPMSQDKSKRESYKKDPKVEEPSHKAMMAIDGIGWDWSFMAEENEASKNQALVAEEAIPTEFALMAQSSSSSDNEIRVLERDLELKDYKIENLTNELEEVKKERDGIDSKLEKFVHASKDLDQMLENQKSGKDKKGVGFDEYSVVPPPPAQIYSPPKLDLSWTGLPKFADDNVTDYTRPTPSVDVTNNELDGNNMSIYEHGGTSSNVVSKHVINFIKGTSTPNVTKVYNTKNIRKPPSVKYAEIYRNTSKNPRVPTDRTKVSTVSSKVPTAEPTVATNKGNKRKAVKALARWIWRPKQDTSNQGSNANGVSGKPLDNIDDKGFWDSGCSRHMTGNISYFSDFEPYDGGYVSFGYGGGKITSKGTIKTGTSSNISGTKEDAKQAEKEKGSPLRFIALPNWFHKTQMTTTNDASKKSGGILINSPQKEQEEVYRDSDAAEQVEHKENEEVLESSEILFPTASPKESSELASSPTVETTFPTVSTPVLTVSENIFTIESSEPPFNSNSEKRVEEYFGDTSHSLNKDKAGLSNMDTTIQVSPTPTLRIHKDHPKDQIIGPIGSSVLTRQKSKNVDEQGFIATIHQKTNPDLLQLCLFSCFLSQEEPKKITDALKDESWLEAMQEELL
ncbi:reverse transcriptase domain-containing protein [Tanacetum coccineum]|uniref:Reverse transcriptase domain-containing protein n=1 Tax=Tanacetum coccineum TaxID=301880 RepID=A0ABQ5IWY7_9ASTR